MGWERRKGGRYYYRSVRVNGAVRKVYVGAGEAGAAQAERDAAEQRRRQAERQARLAEQERVAAPEASALGASGAIFGLFGAWFVLARPLRLERSRPRGSARCAGRRHLLRRQILGL